VGWVPSEKAAVVYYEIAIAMDGFFHRHWPAAAGTQFTQAFRTIMFFGFLAVWLSRGLARLAPDRAALMPCRGGAP